MNSSSLPYIECKTKNGKILKMLIDTGSSKNYIQPCHVPRTIPNAEPFFANSIAGQIKITHHTVINLFGKTGTSLKFFLLPTLKSFDGIIGNDSLKDLHATINIRDDTLTIDNGLQIKIKQKLSPTVNQIDVRTDHMTATQKQHIIQLTRKYPHLFTEPDEKLTYTTTVVGEIRTSSDTPVYTKYYPYPLAMRDFVSQEIQNLLKDGIIRPSCSPYNSPVWVVPKKLDASGQRKYRLVIDYRKLNTLTIADRYPIPEINEVLSQLGNNKYFSVLDLKSGFHQIPLRESDIEKTAFSINNGKYEFTRLPFGLKNAPAIFQRALDDILKDHIGKICYVYIDDIIVFGNNDQSHLENVETIFHTLEKANMKVQLDKCEFFKREVEFLGFIVSPTGLKTNPTKVKAIQDFPCPKTLKDLRSFLGLSGYYRRFIRDYAKLAKPLTSLLRGEDGHVSKNSSSKKPVVFDSNAMTAFNKIKSALTSNEVILHYPNFKEEFHLTTDASNYALGAVLEQSGKPITFISRSLNKTEEHYAANEKEMLAIIWALTSLRNYLYGSAKVVIFTDHQPLTFALSNKNHNGKMKRWKCILEEYNYEMKYKPGRTNVVADALSRPPQTDINTLTTTDHSNESSSHLLIPATEAPINAFKNQLFLKFGNEDSYSFQIPFPSYHRHTITKQNYSEQDIIAIFKRYLDPALINGLHTTESLMGKIQEIYPLHFRNIKIRFTQTLLQDITNETEQEEIIASEHQRAHRNSRENKAQILKKFYFPSMHSKIEKTVRQCSTCREHKYDRHPPKPQIQETPIPQSPGEIVHVDIYSTDKKLILTAIDKFSKYVQVKVIPSRAIEHIKDPIRELMIAFGIPKLVVIDNEKSLNSATISYLLKDQMSINVYTTPPYSSTSNGQIERFHSTLSEIMRCLKANYAGITFEELLFKSVQEYNSSIHSTTKSKPIEIFFGNRIYSDPQQLEQQRQDNIALLKKKQELDLLYHNKNRTENKNFSPGEVIYVKINKRLGSKLTPKYKKETVSENHRTIVKTVSGRTIHKSLIKN